MTELRELEIKKILEHHRKQYPILKNTVEAEWVGNFYRTRKIRNFTKEDTDFVLREFRRIQAMVPTFTVEPVVISKEPKIDYASFDFAGCIEPYSDEELSHFTFTEKRNQDRLVPLSRLRGDAQNLLLVPWQYIQYIVGKVWNLRGMGMEYVSYELEEDLQERDEVWKRYSSHILTEALQRANG